MRDFDHKRICTQSPAASSRRSCALVSWSRPHAAGIARWASAQFGELALFLFLALHSLIIVACQQSNPAFDAFIEPPEASDESSDETDGTTECEDCSGESGDEETQTLDDSTTESSVSSSTTDDADDTNDTTSGESSSDASTSIEESSTSESSSAQTSSDASTSSTTSNSDGIDVTTETDLEIPPDGADIPFPDSPCESDPELILCLLFDRDDGRAYDPRSSDELGRSSNLTVVHHSTKMPVILQSGWRLRTESLIDMQVSQQMSFSSTISIEMWWGLENGNLPNAATLIELYEIVRFSAIDGELECNATATGHRIRFPAIQASPIMYTRCVIKPSKVLISHLPSQTSAQDGSAPSYDFSDVSPELMIGRSPLAETSTAMTIYGLRIWKSAKL
jgi:hypothetical protein